MRAKHFDVIVFGENLAGLIAATLLSLRKYNVLIIRKVAGPGRDAYIGQALRRNRQLVPGVFESPVPAAVIRELNLGHKIRSVLKPASPMFQILSPQHRLSAFDDRVKLVMELSREFGAAAAPAEVESLFGRLDTLNGLLDKFLVPGLPFHPDGLRERWEYSNREKQLTKSLQASEGLLDDMKRLFRETNLGRLMSQVEPFVGDTRGEVHPLWRFRRAALLFSQILYPVGGEGLEEILLARLDKTSAKILEQTALQEVEVNRSGYLFHDAKNTYGAESVICAFDAPLLPELFTGKKMARFLENTAAQISTDAVWIKTSFLLERSVVPEGMDFNVFVLTDDASEPVLFFKRDPLIPSDAEVERLDVYQALPVDRFNAAGASEAQQWAIDRTKRFVPFLEGRLRKVYLEQLRDDDEESLTLRLAGRRLSYRLNDPDRLFGGMPYTLPQANTYLAGPEVLPELGLEGDFHVGWAVARAIGLKKPKKDELKR